jgi:hypothetical protein
MEKKGFLYSSSDTPAKQARSLSQFSKTLDLWFISGNFSKTLDLGLSMVHIDL